MSIEAALVSEIRPHIPLVPTLEAAEALLFNERPSYSNIKPQSCHVHVKGDSGIVRGSKYDKVRHAIEEAKKTATSNRRNHRHNRISHKSESSDIALLRHDVEILKLDNNALHKKIDELTQLILKATSDASSVPASTAAPAPVSTAAPAPPAAPAPDADDDFDLFGSDDENDAEKQRITEERLKAYAEKKSKKPGPIAKSNIIYDVKPWDDSISTDSIEKAVRSIEMDGLVWGAAKKVPVAFGIVKLQICCVVEDDKVSSDALEEAITGFEDLVQSVDVVAFNKV